MTAPPLTGLLETAIYVAEMERARRFYAGTIGLREIAGDGHRFCAFEVAGRDVLLLFLQGSTADTQTLPGGTIPPHDASGQIHFAFSVAAADLPGWEAHLAARGVRVEGRTRWPRGGESVYFRDPDENLLELATPGIWTIY